MSAWGQGWLVAVREIRERSRSRAFQLSMLITIVVVLGAIMAPALVGNGASTKDVGLVGTVPAQLPSTIEEQGHAVEGTVHVRRYDSFAAAQEAVREEKIDVLVVDARRLEWRRQIDEQLQAVVTSAIQLVAVRERAAAAGVDPDAVLALVAPVPVTNVELGQVSGRSPDDETAAFIMTILLFMTISIYGGLVLGGVVEEKSSRVVEVLLARIPARALLAGKVAGIGLLGLAQVSLAALAAFIATATVNSLDIPAVGGAVIAWAVAWFVLGYALYATVFGALGSLASRIEDAQSVAGPISVLLFVGYFVSFATIGSPGTLWARLVSFFPPTAPFAMPNRIAMGATTWWEPAAAAVLTLATIAGLVLLAGRVYAGAILRAGAPVKLRAAWRATARPTLSLDSATPAAGTHLPWEEKRDEPEPLIAQTVKARSHRATAVLIGLAVIIGAAVALLTRDVVIGVAIGAACLAIASKIFTARTPRGDHDDHERTLVGSDRRKR